MPSTINSSRKIEKSAVISSGQSVSTTVFLGNGTLVGLIVPSSWTAANITIQASLNNTTFYDVHFDNGTEYQLSAAASRWITMLPHEVSGILYLRLRSGTSGAPVNQAADRTITLITRAI